MNKFNKFLVPILFLFIVGCIPISKILHSPGHDAKKLDKIHTRNPGITAEKLQQWYPVLAIDSTINNSYKPGVIISIHDTPTVDYTQQVLAQVKGWLPFIADSVRNRLLDSLKRHPLTFRIPCPPSTVRVDTIRISKTLVKIDSNDHIVLKHQVDSLSSLVTTKNNKIATLNGWRLSLGGIIFAILILGYFLIKRKK